MMLFYFTQGLLEGLGNGVLYKNSEECIGGIPKLYNEFFVIIKLLKEISLKNIESIKKIIEEVLKTFKEIYETLLFCVKSPLDLADIIKKLINIDGTKIYERVILYQLIIMKNIGLIFSEFMGRNFKASGKALGEIIYLIIIKE